MMKNILEILKRVIPQPIFLVYHWLLAYLASFIYGFPSKKMIVIGVTGTSGKSTTVNLIAEILSQAGFKVGLTTTFNFKIGDQQWENKTKMTMLGRFALQKLLRQMLKTGCSYAVIETSSQGVAQYRHLGINYDIGVFTNLSPEHVEAHGSFAKYRQAKQNFFQHLAKSKRKKINDKLIGKINVINLDDENKEYFLNFKTDKQYGYKIKSKIKNQKSKISILRSSGIFRFVEFLTNQIYRLLKVNFYKLTATAEDGQTKDIKIIQAEDVVLDFNGLRFRLDSTNFKMNLFGKFNVYNALAAIAVALSQGIGFDVCEKALRMIKQIPGRMEIVSQKPFVLVDYAHTPDSLKKVYQTLRPLTKEKLICVLGSAGGGRDKWKRPIMGETAEKYCDEIIVTNEDPYDENPEEIIDQIVSGINNKKAVRIIDRRKAIERALDIAEKQDMVVITGKGCEPWIMGPKGKRFSWDDREVVKELLNR